MQDILSKINQYCEDHSTIHDPILDEIERTTHLKTLSPRMLSGKLQGSVLSMISKIKSPKYILEIGSFTGFSAICLAQGLQDDGKLITIEYDPENASIASNFFTINSTSKNIELLIGDAKELIPTIELHFDLVFIDADKDAYMTYYNLIIDKCNPGAIILADNVLWSGKVLDENMDNKTKCLDDFNKMVAADPRVENVILPIRDGINVIRKL
jgi:predicted O-methyltransferase YrrM